MDIHINSEIVIAILTYQHPINFGPLEFFFEINHKIQK